VPVYALAWSNNSLWLASQNGIYSFQNGTISQVAQVDGKPTGRLNAVLKASDGSIWMGGDEGIFKLQNGRWAAVMRRKAEVMALAETQDGKIMAGIFNSGILILDGPNRRYLNTTNGLPSNKVQCLWYSKNQPDELWIGTQDAGVVRWGMRENHFTQITENQGLCNQNVRSILADSWWRVAWFGTSGGGLCKYAAQDFEQLTMEDGLRSNFIYSLCKDAGGIWLSAGDRGISLWDLEGDTLVHFGAANGFANVKCRAMHKDRSNRIWVGTEGLGLAVYRDSSFQFFTKKQGLAGNWIRDIAEDSHGNIWAATTDGGISKMVVGTRDLNNVLFQNFHAENGLPDKTVHALHFDKIGRLWFATQEGGIGFIENDKVTVPGPESSLPFAAVRSLAEDRFGHLWAGTAGRGIGFIDLYKNQPFKFSMSDQQDSLASANVYLLDVEYPNLLWVGTEKGLDRVAIDSSGNFLAVKNYGRAEGFTGIETCQNASLDGTYFGTINGLMIRRSTADSLHGGAPNPVLTGVRLFYEPLEKSGMAQWSTNWGGLVDGAVFPYHQNHLSFEFYAIDFANQERVTYSWQLAGLEENWSPFSNRTEVNYAKLPPGQYTFQIRARNEDGVVSAPLKTSFTIEPPFWAAWWFQLAIAVAVAFAAWGLFRWRIRLVKNKAAQERQQLELQNRLLTLEQKARQLQMNPHFIFNALNSIQSLVTAGNMDNARQYILKFGKLMRAVLDNSRQPLIPLEKEVETLRQYLEMEQFCRDGKFEFDLKTEGILDGHLQIPPMLIQPFVENAILHGVGPLSQRKGLVEVVFEEKDQLLEVTIRDNGIGIEQSQGKKRLEQPNARQSAGIAVTRERLELLRKDTGYTGEVVEMKQLVADDGEVEGTEVRVRVALVPQ
jgi:ligand-binding sensor domain-containing protein